MVKNNTSLKFLTYKKKKKNTDVGKNGESFYHLRY